MAEGLGGTSHLPERQEINTIQPESVDYVYTEHSGHYIMLMFNIGINSLSTSCMNNLYLNYDLAFLQYEHLFK